MSDCFVGVDVGTSSARAGVFDADGRMLGAAQEAIQTWRDGGTIAEQSTDDIWRACGAAVRTAVISAGIDPDRIRGVGFDATCSLVAVDAGGRPVSVSQTGEDERNVIVWMDHRATVEAEFINATEHEVLRFVGGTISPEMQAPKLRWLKNNLPQTWARTAHFFDLADYLSYRASGSIVRSTCTTVCKWTYLAHAAHDKGSTLDGWADDFWRAAGLEEFVKEKYRRIGQSVRPIGEPIGKGLTESAARDLGLAEGTAVGVGAIDAHAGALGLIGTRSDGHLLSDTTLSERLALIGGTSSCHLAISPSPLYIEGVWGPYFSALIPGMWLTEGGQSATGALIDHVIFSHSRATELQGHADSRGCTVYDLLNETLDRLSSVYPFQALLTRERHVLPYFHGNRSPRADASLRGIATGLRLSDSVEELSLLYLATVQAIAYGTRHIIAELNRKGFNINTLVMAGGGTKNSVFVREHADVTGCRVLLPTERESVLLGAAMLGAVAARTYTSLVDAIKAMSSDGDVIDPQGGAIAAYHHAKYAVFHRMYDDYLAYKRIMDPTQSDGHEHK
jgi:FGGY-family pentulose kinase